MRTVLQMWALRLGYALGVSPARLWRHYYGGQSEHASRDAAVIQFARAPVPGQVKTR